MVPYARGRSRSLPVQPVLAQAAAYADSGHREIVVTGIHVGRYGADLSDNCHIVELLDILCGRFPGIRFRLSSIEPLEISDDLLALMADTENLMPHLHIPLQSGDSEILKRMNRRYSAEQYAKVVAACRSALPDAAIGVDVMVGFPGETEEHFNNSRNLIESVGCSSGAAAAQANDAGGRRSDGWHVGYAVVLEHRHTHGRTIPFYRQRLRRCEGARGLHFEPPARRHRHVARAQGARGISQHARAGMI
ncbi:MAG: radical SAM protein, partial [Candidatus Promineifilaceae bacterium]